MLFRVNMFFAFVKFLDLHLILVVLKHFFPSYDFLFKVSKVIHSLYFSGFLSDIFLLSYSFVTFFKPVSSFCGRASR